MATPSVSTHDSGKTTRTTFRVVLLLSAVLSVVFLFSFFFSEEGISELHRTQKRVTALETEIERLEAENERLEATLNDLDKSTFTVERIAREDLGMARPGETVYRVSDPDETDTAKPTPAPGS